MNEVKIFNQENTPQKFSLQRRDIVDRNGILISRNIKSFHAAINPNLIYIENNLIKLRLNFPEYLLRIEKNYEGKYFYLKRRINQIEKRLWSLGEKDYFLNHSKPEFILIAIYLVT